MASTKLKRRDLNRFRKVYPYLRRRPVYGFVSDEELVVEVGKVIFSDSSSEVYNFVETYTSVPTITAISVDSEVNGTAGEFKNTPYITLLSNDNTNLFISNVSSSGFNINVSNFTTNITVKYHAIERS